jgi:hypothetical protein
MPRKTMYGLRFGIMRRSNNGNGTKTKKSKVACPVADFRISLKQIECFTWNNFAIVTETEV